MCVVRHRCEAVGAASQRAACGGWTRLRPPRAEFSRYEIRRALRIASDASSGPRRAAASLRNIESFWAAARPWRGRRGPPAAGKPISANTQPFREKIGVKRSVAMCTLTRHDNSMNIRRSVRAIKHNANLEHAAKNLLARSWSCGFGQWVYDSSQRPNSPPDILHSTSHTRPRTEEAPRCPSLCAAPARAARVHRL